VAQTLAHIAPDVVLLTGIDWDYDLHVLTALADIVRDAGQDYPHLFALRPNSGLATEYDMDGDGYTGGPGDAQGYGRFSGQGGMAILSKLPIDTDAVQDFSAMLWADLPGAVLPSVDGVPYPSASALKIQRLSSVGHWVVPLRPETGPPLTLLAYAANPPVFDGPEDRNGKRNRDENALWQRYLSGALPLLPPDTPVILLGNANLDPVDGEGLKPAITALLSHPRLQDPRPRSTGGAEAAKSQGGANTAQQGDPGLDTADWRDEDGPGNLRVSYVLPDIALRVTASGVFWPAKDDPDALNAPAPNKNNPRHHLVWVDIDTDE